MLERHRRQGGSRCSQGRRKDQIRAVAVCEQCVLSGPDIPCLWQTPEASAAAQDSSSGRHTARTEARHRPLSLLPIALLQHVTVLDLCRAGSFQAVLACWDMPLTAASNDLCVCVDACRKAAQENLTQAFLSSYILMHKHFKDCTSRRVSFLPTGERYVLIGEQESMIEKNTWTGMGAGARRAGTLALQTWGKHPGARQKGAGSDPSHPPPPDDYLHAVTSSISSVAHSAQPCCTCGGTVQEW